VTGQPGAGRPHLLTAKEIANCLRVTPRWIYEQVDKHEMPAYRLGARALRFDLDAVSGWLDSRRIGAWDPPIGLGPGNENSPAA
jgi:excisionase family DNA binding protein